jgi:hypothetical protein
MDGVPHLLSPLYCAINEDGFGTPTMACTYGSGPSSAGEDVPGLGACGDGDAFSAGSQDSFDASADCTEYVIYVKYIDGLADCSTPTSSSSMTSVASASSLTSSTAALSSYSSAAAMLSSSSVPTALPNPVQYFNIMGARQHANQPYLYAQSIVHSPQENFVFFSLTTPSGASVFYLNATNDINSISGGLLVQAGTGYVAFGRPTSSQYIVPLVPLLNNTVSGGGYSPLHCAVQANNTGLPILTCQYSNGSIAQFGSFSGELQGTGAGYVFDGYNNVATDLRVVYLNGTYPPVSSTTSSVLSSRTSTSTSVMQAPTP